ncbi:MAG: outer membrane beta-barrel protein [Deltaproteobacteria bacterium]|nr:outer membrane beta-barrel protein [Deltaproteobacteria bacterium]
MKRLTILFFVLTLLLPLGNLSSHAQSQSEEIEQLKQMIEQNRQQNEALMKKVEQMEAEKATNQVKVEEFMIKQEKQDAKVNSFMSFFDTIDLGFAVDTSYQYVFDRGSTNELQLRSLYPDNQQFAFNAFTISISKTPTLEGGVQDLLGFRADILFGEEALNLSSRGFRNDVIDPYQVYLQFLAPVGTGLNVYAGRFSTLAGYEVIEARNNPNITRSILFGFAIPFTHTGIRTDYTAGPVTLSAGLNNGWDSVQSANGNATIESQIAFSHSGGMITDSWFGVTGYFGKEPGDIGFGETFGWRELITAVGTVTLNDWLTFVVDADFGWQQDIIFNELASEEGVSWWGIAGYIVADVHPAITLALRGEYFDDTDGFRTGTAQKLFELTPTIAFKPFKGLIAGNRFIDNFEARAEFRWDHSDERYFETNDGGLEKDQYGVMGQLLYWIEL